MKRTFEDFLLDKHAKQFVGSKHTMVDDSADWIANLSPDEFIEYGDEFAKKEYKDFRKKALSKLQELIDWLNCW